jgi:hypothetical protein
VQQPHLRGIPRHLQALETWIRHGRTERQLQRDLGRWNQIRSSLNALRQTHIAIETFNRANGNLSHGERILAIYGLLQALVVQQDALCHLAEALGARPLRLNRHRRLEEIRNIRNWTVGHPTKIDRYDVASHHAITRTKLGRGGFALYSAFDDGRTQYTYVPLPQLARLQRRVISQLLRDLLAQVSEGGTQKETVAPKPVLVANRVPAPPHRGAQRASFKFKTAGSRRHQLRPAPVSDGGNGSGQLSRHRVSKPLPRGVHPHPQRRGSKRFNGAADAAMPRNWVQKENPPPLVPQRVFVNQPLRRAI